VLFLLVVVQRENIKSCFKLGRTAEARHELLGAANGNETSSRTRVFEWHKEPRVELEKLSSYPSSGRPTNFYKPGNSCKIL
jgi:hypothetical protein